MKVKNARAAAKGAREFLKIVQEFQFLFSFLCKGTRGEKFSRHCVLRINPGTRLIRIRVLVRVIKSQKQDEDIVLVRVREGGMGAIYLADSRTFK